MFDGSGLAAAHRSETDKAEAERLGGLAVKAGIGSIDISDEDLTREMEAIVKRLTVTAAGAPFIHSL